MNNILNLLPAFFAGMFACAGLVLLLHAHHLIPAIVAKIKSQQHVSLVELLDAMFKLQLVEASKALLATKYYEDDINAKLDPDSIKLLKKLADGNDEGQ